MKNELIEWIVMLVIIVGMCCSSAYAGYRVDESRHDKADKKALQDAMSRVKQVTDSNTILAADNAKLLDKVADLNHSIANQPVKERIVYVHPKPTAQNPTPAPTAISGPVFVTLGAVSLYDSVYGLSEGASASSGDSEGSGSLSSNVTTGDYERVATANGPACYQNQQTVILLWRYIHGLQAAGFVEH